MQAAALTGAAPILPVNNEKPRNRPKSHDRLLTGTASVRVAFGDPGGQFHLGIDYGTYASKLVFRDFEAAGGEKAYAVKGKQFRIPSAVGIGPSEVILGQHPSGQGLTWVESLKMRLAGAVKHDYDAYYSGPPTPLPPELTEKALATLTVWYLISEGHHAINRYLSSLNAISPWRSRSGFPQVF